MPYVDAKKFAFFLSPILSVLFPDVCLSFFFSWFGFVFGFFVYFGFFWREELGCSCRLFECYTFRLCVFKLFNKSKQIFVSVTLIKFCNNALLVFGACLGVYLYI